MLNVTTYDLLATDDSATTEGKYEAILDVVCAEGNKSDVIPSANGRDVNVEYAEGERPRLEPIVLAIINNTDGTFWEIAQGKRTVRQFTEVEKAIVRTVATYPLCTWMTIQQVCYPSWHIKPQQALERAYQSLLDDGVIRMEGAYYVTDWSLEEIEAGVKAGAKEE